MNEKVNIPVIKSSDLEKLLEVLDKMENPPALMVYGPPGIGKTTILKNFAEKKDYELRVKHLSRMDQTDWSGLPKENQGFTGFLPISIFKPAKDNRKIVLFFDELNTAHPGVLNAALDVILEKKGDTETLGEKAELPKNTIIVAAGNLGPEEDGTYVEELSMAVKTRMIQVRLEPDVNDWISWAEKHNIHKFIMEFIKEDEKNLLDLEEFKNRNDQAVTPRGWERISDFLKTLEDYKKEEVEKIKILENFVCGVIGKAKGKDFIEFYKNKLKKENNWEAEIKKYEYLFNKDNLITEIKNAKELFELINMGLQKELPRAKEYAHQFVEKILKKEKSLINSLRQKENREFMVFLEEKYYEIYLEFPKN